MYRHFIWDFDGTLFDSYSLITEALSLALEEFGIRADKGQLYSELKIFVTKAVEKYMKMYGLGDELVKAFKKHLRDMENENLKPYPNAAQLCREIVEMGGYNYLFTHRGASAVDFLKSFGMAELFRECVTSENGFKRKPSPQAINYLAEKYQMNPAEAVMIGDREIDLISGKDAGISAWLFNDGTAAQSPYADKCFTGFKEISAFIHKP